MKTEPLVSVLLPVYNAGEYLRPSVQSILSQTYSNLEILIIDDGSTDGCMDTITSLEDSRIRIISQKNSGKAVALNRALEELSGEFYAIQDADDISYPQRIERQVECMLDNPKLAAVFTGFNMILRGQCVCLGLPPKVSKSAVVALKRCAYRPTMLWECSEYQWCVTYAMNRL